MSVLMVCQFGQPVRGLSPYGDALLGALQAREDIRVSPVDYRAPYPDMLHPAGYDQGPEAGLIHWGNPVSWYRAAHLPGDIIHFQHWSAPMAGYLAPLAYLARKAGKRVVITVHNPAAHETLAWSEALEQRFLAQAHTLIVHDRRGREVLQGRLKPHGQEIVVIPHGVRPAGAPEPAAPEDYAGFDLDPGRRYVCIFGNLRGYKGIDVLLRAWMEVAPRLPDVDLVIAGRLWSGGSGIGRRLTARMLGTHREQVRLSALLAKPTLAGRVHLFQGFQSDRRIDALLRLAQFAVFPYVRFASQSGAACRAAGLGRPILVSDVGGLPELAIDDDWIVPPGDAGALAGRLSRLLQDPATVNDAPARQLQRIQSCSWEQVAARHVQVYRQS